MKGANQILELLVGDHSADEHDVGPLVVEITGQPIIGSAIEVTEIRNHGQDRSAREAQRAQLLTVVVGISERQLTSSDVRGQFSTAVETQLHELFMYADEVRGRRDVVIEERHAPWQRVRRPRRARANREVMNEEISCTDRADELAVVDRLVFESRIGSLDEDIRVVSGAAQHTLDPEDLVSNGVAVSERGEDLMDTWPVWLAKVHADLERSLVTVAPGITAPPGMPESTSAAGRWFRCLRANHPPRGSSGRRAPTEASSCFNRSNMSRYLPSITGHV